MSLEHRIKEKIQEHLQPEFFEIVNESSKHAHGSAESHFKILVVSKAFQGMNRIARQRLIFNLLGEEMQQGVHALAQKALTPEEWNTNNSEFKTPDCKGN
ncbi:MAG: BolA family transcriptional regulator [Bdellovibrionales bacterium]|nr:BolA family transcriptional regulator [Bdellovibrionales bacterium]